MKFIFEVPAAKKQVAPVAPVECWCRAHDHCSISECRPKKSYVKLHGQTTTNHGNGSLSETVRKKNEFTGQLAVFEGNFDNEIFMFILRPFHIFNSTF